MYKLQFEDQKVLYAFFLCSFKLVYLVKTKIEVIGRTFKISVASVMSGLNCLFFINLRKFYDQTAV